VLAAIGQSIEWGNLLDGTAVELNGNRTAKTVPVSGYEIYQGAKYVEGREAEWVDLPEPIEVWQTKQPDIFVGGDAHTGPRFAIDAIAEGKEAAESLHRFVWEGHNLVLNRDRRRYRYLNKDNMVVEEYDKTPRVKIAHKPELEKTFQDPRITMTEEQIKAETARCLSCGAAHVDPEICIGCGLCTTRCKFDAIHLHKTFDAWPVPYEEVVPRLASNVLAREGRIIKRKLKGKK
jgi:ferredoxin